MTPADDLVHVEYEQHKREVIRTVRAKLDAAGATISENDLDACYNEAWHALYVAVAGGEKIENRVGYLVTVAHRRALNEYRAFNVARRADPSHLSEVGTEIDLDARLDAEIQLRHVREGFRAALSRRELEAATLCHLYGYTRREAAAALGVRPRRMEKIMDAASSKIGTVVARVKAGEHCTHLRSGVRAFALGILDPEGERYSLIKDHLEGCPACRREVRTQRGLAAIGPPLPVAFAILSGGATAGSGLVAGSGLHGSSGSAAGGKAAAAGASTGRKAAIAGGVASSAAVVTVAAAVATGWVGGKGDGDGAVTGGGTASVQTGAGAMVAAPADRAGKTTRRKARRRKAERRREARRVEATRRRDAAARANQVPEPVYVPEPEYVPPPVAVAEPEPPVPVPEPPPAEPTRPEPPAEPTTDAGEEFGLR